MLRSGARARMSWVAGGLVCLGELTLAEADKTPSYPAHALLRKADARGTVGYDGLAIILPRRYAGATVRILEIGELIHVYLGDQLIRALAPDRSIRYQKLGTRTRGRRRPQP